MINTISWSVFILLSSLMLECKSTIISSDPCFTDRNVIDTITELKVSCKDIGNTIVLYADDNKRFSVCNADAYQYEAGKHYLISGKTYEIKPNERWPGTPLEVTEIKKI